MRFPIFENSYLTAAHLIIGMFYIMVFILCHPSSFITDDLVA
jgi:hypothetical protein